MMKHIKSWTFLVCLFEFGVNYEVTAQTVTSEGKEYYIGIPYPSYNNVNPYLQNTGTMYYANITNRQDNTINVTFFDERTGKESDQTVYRVSALKSISILLDIDKIKMSDPGDQNAEYRTYRIVTHKPVSITVIAKGACSGGSYLALPTSVLGKNYVVASYNDNPFGLNAAIGDKGPGLYERACGAFLIIAPHDKTQVTITPTVTTNGGNHKGVLYGKGANGKPSPYTITLNRGQSYFVRSICEQAYYDITGTVINADKPLSVISAHENAGIGWTNNMNVDGRDFMIEQMLPVELWDTVGYISIPMHEGNAVLWNDKGIGENIRVITADSNGAKIILKLESMNAEFDLSVTKYHIGERQQIRNTAHLRSINSKKFLAYQIDRARQTSREFPRPSMMQLIPKKNWLNSYVWSTLQTHNDINDSNSEHYITVIGLKGATGRMLLDSVNVVVNGEAEKSLSKAFSLIRQFDTIPDHPDLMAACFSIDTGTYWAYAKFNFVIYQYGFQKFDPLHHNNTYDKSQQFSSYASPVGFTSTQKLDTGGMYIQVDTLCNGWRICAETTSDDDHMLRAAILDCDDCEKSTITGKNYQYENVQFSTADDSSQNDIIIFHDSLQRQCIEVVISNPMYDAYAPIIFQDSRLNSAVIELQRGKRQVIFHPDKYRNTWFGNIPIGKNIDTIFMFINKPESRDTFILEHLFFDSASSDFQVEAVNQSLPAVIAPGDTFKYRIISLSKDTIEYHGQLHFVTSCFDRSSYFGYKGVFNTQNVIDRGMPTRVSIHSNTVTGSILRLHITSSYDENVVVQISDLLGEIRLKKNYPLIDDLGDIRIDVSSYPPGVYFVSISTSTRSAQMKFIKQ